ncbi:MAG: ABC transporter permease subunit [Actinomycetota bacterium]
MPQLARRVRVAGAIVILLGWATARADWSTIVNADGWSAFARFWTSATRPDLSSDFVRLTWDATLQTLAVAVLGTVVALLLGLAGAVLSSGRTVGSSTLQHIIASVGAVPRATHEILVALLLVQVFGFDPLVAVLAIGIPFGAVSAKVFADAIDDADRATFDALRSMGASRSRAAVYGIGPLVRAEFTAYGFYRLECAIRSAAVLGIVGVGGLGFQVDLSFESLRYREIWTLILALVLLSGAADALSSAVRRSRRPFPLRWTLALGAVAVTWSAWQAGVSTSLLWSERTRRQIVDFGRELVPPRLGPGGWRELADATLDTIALAFLALAIAVVLGLVGAMAARRTPPMMRSGSRWFAAARRTIAKLALLLGRAVPAPIWAFLFVLILFPGLWPGAAALGIYNAGVLGRLFAEAIETQPDDVERNVGLTGATSASRWAYGVIPQALPRLVSLSLYRGEVIVRETIVIGVVGAGGLGQLLREHLAARDFQAVSGAIIVFVVLAIAADRLGARLRPASTLSPRDRRAATPSPSEPSRPRDRPVRATAADRRTDQRDRDRRRTSVVNSPHEG